MDHFSVVSEVASRDCSSATMCNKKDGLRPRWAIIIAICSLSTFTVYVTNADRVSMKLSDDRRVEGRVSMEYTKNNETLNYQMAFTEVVDARTMRSKTSIGYISYEPKVYYYRDGVILSVDHTGNCVSLQQERYKFVPELDWFLKLSFTDEELEQLLKPDKIHNIGPSGVIIMLAKYVSSVYVSLSACLRNAYAHENQPDQIAPFINSSRFPLQCSQTKFDHLETHRNIECQVTSATYDRTKAKGILYEVLVPDVKLFDSKSLPFFTVRETVKNILLASGDQVSTKLTIDYFYTEDLDKANAHQLHTLEADLSLPLGVGCSAHLSSTARPQTTAQSFLMSYTQSSSQLAYGLAYDHESSLLRKEVVGRSVTVWDLREDLVYHVDQATAGADGKLSNSVDIEIPFELCSVLSAETKDTPDDATNAGSATSLGMTKPYDLLGSSLDVLKFLGAQELKYMGQTTVRDLPCWIFESIVSEPPRLFEIDLVADRSRLRKDFEYIVQFHIFKTTAESTESLLKRYKQLYRENNNSSSALPIVGDQFWPARITLYKRHQPTGRTHLADIIEVGDFHWGLYGWTKKPSELFMLADCFNDEDEQLRMSLLVDFERLNFEDNRRLVRHNKYQLEHDLLFELFNNLLRISPLHMTEFELTLRPHGVLTNLVISDRIEGKRVSHFGEGDLPTPETYLNNKIVLDQITRESDCLMTASHIDQIALAIFCPPYGTQREATCTAVFDEPQPVIKRATPASTGSQLDPFSESSACQVYRFQTGSSPKAATHDVDAVRRGLLNHHVNFVLSTPENMELQLRGRIIDFDVSREQQLIKIANYKYNVTATKSESRETVRSYTNIEYNSLGECAKICNLDVRCKSFSYCADKKLAPGERCVLSSLDLRANKVEQQLVSAKMTANNQVIVDGPRAPESHASGTRIEYVLDLKSSCNIHERDFLNMFAQTDEVLRLPARSAVHFLSTSSATECARWVNSLEVDTARSMFAYCANTNTCLVDEDLMQTLDGKNSTRMANEEGGADEQEQELSCQIYRRRYQNYFLMSTAVLRLQTPGVERPNDGGKSPIEQVGLQYNTVEQCARACWQQYGHVCLSFDYCEPQSCILNLIDGAHSSIDVNDLLNSLVWETRSGCLHYERDLVLDNLRRDHLLGWHKPLELRFESRNSNSQAHPLVLLSLVAVLFVVGLALGKPFNDKIQAFPMRRARSDTIRTLSDSDDGLGMQSNQKSSFNIENEVYEDGNAIRMEEMGQRSSLTETETSQTHDYASIDEEKGSAVGEVAAIKSETNLMSL